MTVQDHPLDPDFPVGPEFRLWIDLNVEPPRIGIAGDVDLATCAPLRDALALACEKDTTCVALDLRDVSFMGSTGIREIARALSQTERIEIHAPSPGVRRVFEMVSLGPRVVVVD